MKRGIFKGLRLVGFEKVIVGRSVLEGKRDRDSLRIENFCFCWRQFDVGCRSRKVLGGLGWSTRVETGEIRASLSRVGLICPSSGEYCNGGLLFVPMSCLFVGDFCSRICVYEAKVFLVRKQLKRQVVDESYC